MNHTIEQGQTSFKIKAENIPGAFEAIRNLAFHNMMLGDANSQIIITADTFERAFKYIGWDLKFSPGNTEVLTFSKTKELLQNLTDKIKNDGASIEFIAASLDEILFKLPIEKDIIDIVNIDNKMINTVDMFRICETIAPYVEEGSFIEIFGSDGSHWRWVFENNTAVVKRPKLIW